MKINENFEILYLSSTPLALSLERIIECRIHSSRSFNRPILDIGCGDGVFAKAFFGDKVDTGIDPDPRELEQARRLGAYVELIQCSGHSIPKPSGFYNTIISNSVLEHIKDIKPVLKEANRLLAPGGSFYCTVPSNYFDQYSIPNQLLITFGLQGLARRYRIFFNSFWKQYHCYPVGQWKKLVRNCGFKIRECFAFNPKRLCLLNDFLAPFGFPAFIIKKLFNRWFLLPKLRRILVSPLQSIVKRIYSNGETSHDKGSLIYLHLTKK